jgi:hypothetical protein
MSRDREITLFPTLKRAHDLLNHFRFVAHNFVCSLTSYFFDTVVRGHFDAFLESILVASGTPFDGKENTKSGRQYTDVFALAQTHADILDEMLSACLLRSGQKGINDILHSVLEVILDLGVLAGDVHQGHLQEYQALPTLEDLWAAFCRRTKRLVRY